MWEAIHLSPYVRLYIIGAFFGYHDSANAAFRATILGDTGSERHKGAIAGVVSEATGTTGEHFR